MTARRVTTTTQADLDIAHAVDYLVSTGANEAALSLIDALESATKYIATFPSIGSSRFALETEIPDLRDFALDRFPYILFYTDDADAVRIHRVLHTSQDIPAEFTA